MKFPHIEVLLKSCAVLFLLSMLASNAFAQDTLEITDPSLNPPREYEILEIVVQGNDVVNESFISTSSGLRVGNKVIIPGELLGNAVKRLYGSGLFSDVQILISEKTLTGVRLIIKVTEQPRLIDFEIRGVKRSQRKELKKRINLIPGTAVTDASVSQAINTIIRFYRERGHWGTEVTTETEVSDVADDRVNLIFNVKAGRKWEVRKLVFEGNDSFKYKTLRKQIKPLKVDRWWKFLGKQVFKREDFEEGKQKILDLYSKNGFMDARIVADSVYLYEYKKGKMGVRVDVDIEEGPQYKVRDIIFDGNTVYTDEQLKLALDFEKGDIFDQERFEANISFNNKNTDLTSLYHDIGYLFSRIFPDIRVVAEDSLDIIIEIFEDEIATVRDVTFFGNTRTHDDVVRRSLRVVPGSTYSRQLLVRTIRELGVLGFFTPDKIQPDVQSNPEDKTADISFSLEESQSTDNFEFSGGFGGRGIGVILSARVNFNNFSLRRMFEKGGWTPIPSGDGQRLSLGVQLTGTGFQSYTLGFTEPWLNGKPTSLGVNFSYNLINFNNSDERNELFSTSVSVGKRLRWPDDFFSTQTVISYQIFNVTGGVSFLAEGTSSLFSIQQILERNSLDNFISPNSGSKLTLSGEIAPPLPDFSEFYKIKTAYQYHIPFYGKWVLSTINEFGYIGFLTKNKRTDFQRFFVGGTQLQQRQSFLDDNIDLRGFPGGINGTISPSVNGEQVGGTIFSKYSMEIRYPLLQNEQLQVIPYGFYDAGNSYLNFQEFDPFDVKRAIGFGARVFLPILGLVDLSYGYRLDGIDGINGVRPKQWEFLFNIGAPF